MKPLIQAEPIKAKSTRQSIIRKYMGMGFGKKKAKSMFNDALRGKWWKNDVYTVIVRQGQDMPPEYNPQGMHNLVWISFRRNDRKPITDWRDKQEIKNQMLGAECEAVEIYPAESRLNDTANQYHMFGFNSPKVQFPFGLVNRLVTEDTVGNSEQRPFERTND